MKKSRRVEIIRKKDFRIKPNLKNYERAYRCFDWADVKKEMEWFAKGRMNAAHNAIDRHAMSWRKNKVALYFEPAEGPSRKFTFLEMCELSNRFANVLKKLKTKKGDRIFIFLPRIPECYVSFLGILKTGAIAGTLFAAFGEDALKDRLQNSQARILITDSELVKRIYRVKKHLPDLKYIILVDRDAKKKGEISYHKEMEKASEEFRTVKTKPTDPAFLLYTSGSTGKPKGILHMHQAIIQEHITAKWVLDMHDRDVWWCTADPGWVTGIAYEILGSWSNGVSSVVYEGRFDPAKWYSIIEKYNVTTWYTAPTAVRILMQAGEKLPKKYDFSTLRTIYSVGEPLNPEAIRWGLKVFGLPFHDTWWQTETGSILIANYPILPIKLGSMGKPFPGIDAGIVDDKGKELGPLQEGNLAIRPGWPSMFKTVFRNRRRYRKYFRKGWYISGDRAFKDKDGYFWFVGRADDVIKTAGERVGPFEVESALVEHPAVVEAGVIGKPDPIRGEIIKAFVTLAKGYKPSKKLVKEIQLFMKKKYAGHAYPKEIEFVQSLPKTRSGKIMRRVLKARELGLPVGDISTLEEY